MDGASGTNGEKRSLARVLVRKLEGKRPLGRPRCRWEDNIKMLPQELVFYGGVDWVDLAQDGGTDEKALVNLQVP